MLEQQTQTREQTTVSAPTTQQIIRRTKTVVPQQVAQNLQNEYKTKKAIFRTYQVVWYILGIIEVLLAFRVILKLLGANTSSEFTNFIYQLSNPLALPFAGILGITSVSDMRFEWSTLIAMAVYSIIVYGIVELIQIVKPTNVEEVEQTIDN